MSKVLKISRSTKKKLTKFEIIIWELCEKILEVLTLKPVVIYIENLILNRKFKLQRKFEKKLRQDKKAKIWEKLNPWFGSDTVMTYTALDIHRKLVEEEGYNPKSEDYYKELDKRLYQEFPLKMKRYFSSNN
jgi:GH15 family glucan-1,4-alpha-glucosidase